MRKLVALCMFLVLTCLATACVEETPLPAPIGEKGRTGEKQVSVAWVHDFNPDVLHFEQVLVNHPLGPMFGYWSNSGQESVYVRTVLDAKTGNVIHKGGTQLAIPSSSSPNAILYIEGGETLLDNNEGMMIELPQLPVAHGWLDILQHEGGVALFGYDQSGRFITYLNRVGESLWSYRPPRRLPENSFVFEAFGSRDTIVNLGNGLLGVYGTNVCGLIAIDSNTGQVAWEYHLPKEDRISTAAAGDDGIWIGGLGDDNTGVVALLGADGSVLREIEHPAPVVAIGALEDQACWFMAGWGPDGRNKVYLLEQDHLAVEVLGDIEFGAVPQIDGSLIFLDGIKGLLYRWQLGQDPEANELPFYGIPSQSRVLGARDGMVILQHKNEIYAFAVEE